MKKFLVVLQYELKEYVRNKSFVITTLLFAILGSAALFLPRVIDMSGFLGTQTPSQEEAPDQSQSEEADKETMLLYDQAGVTIQVTITIIIRTQIIISRSKSQPPL